MKPRKTELSQRNVTKLLANLSRSHDFLIQFRNWIKIITLFNLKMEKPSDPEMQLVYAEMHEYLKDIVDLYFSSQQKMTKMYDLCSTLKNNTKRISEEELTWNEVNDWSLEENEYGEGMLKNESTGEVIDFPWLGE